MLETNAGNSSPGQAELPRTIFDYEVIDFLGEGAGSAIYAVSHPETRQIYALKHVRIRTEKDQRFVEQLETEFNVSRQFSHPTLRRAFDFRDNHTLFRKPTEACLVMELFDGLPLDIHRPADAAGLLDCFIPVAQGLAALHALRYVHCDLKPNNILLAPGGEVKIIDFGQACPIGSIKERIQGTPDFISPEQVRREPVTPRTDVFNFGATLYWALVGRPIPTLFNLKRSENSFLVDAAIASPRDINNTIPEPLSNLVMECIRSQPAKRPQDMPELTRRLEVVRHAVARRGAAVA